jgi:hypothetical protein
MIEDVHACHGRPPRPALPHMCATYTEHLHHPGLTCTRRRLHALRSGAEWGVRRRLHLLDTESQRPELAGARNLLRPETWLPPAPSRRLGGFSSPTAGGSGHDAKAHRASVGGCANAAPRQRLGARWGGPHFGVEIRGRPTCFRPSFHITRSIRHGLDTRNGSIWCAYASWMQASRPLALDSDATHNESRPQNVGFGVHTLLCH